MLSLSINRNLDVPVYEQVADQLRRFVAEGKLAPGAVLPPVRQIAGDLGVNLNTIARAYRLLEGEGFLVIRDRSGVVVAPAAEVIDKSVRTALLDQMRTTIARLRQAGMGTDELLTILQREVTALEAGGKGKDDG